MALLDDSIKKNVFIDKKEKNIIFKKTALPNLLNFSEAYQVYELNEGQNFYLL